MLDPLTRKLKMSLVLFALLPMQAVLTDETTEDSEDPCEDLLVVISSDEEEDAENTSKSLDLSIQKLDECLDGLLYGDSGDNVANSTATSANSSLEAPNSGESAVAGSDNSNNLTSSLAGLDQHLASQDIELKPMGQQSRDTSRSGERKDSKDSGSRLVSHLDPEEQSADTEVSPGDASDNAGRSELQGGDPTQDSKHAEPNRQPADPEDEDELLKQLREAAEKESNPRTKQALWDQYYEYLDNRKKE